MAGKPSGARHGNRTPFTITPHEQQILDLLDRGHTRREIAEILGYRNTHDVGSNLVRAVDKRKLLLLETRLKTSKTISLKRAHGYPTITKPSGVN